MINDVTPPAEQHPAPSQKQVLCIEDEPFISDLYKRALNKAGFKVDIIAEGEAGLAAIRSDRYDIVLLDIMIPQMLGVDVLHELKEERGKLKAKIVICTNLEQDEKTRNAIEAEADGYIIKAEITPRELVEILKQM